MWNDSACVFTVKTHEMMGSRLLKGKLSIVTGAARGKGIFWISFTGIELTTNSQALGVRLRRTLPVREALLY